MDTFFDKWFPLFMSRRLPFFNGNFASVLKDVFLYEQRPHFKNNPFLITNSENCFDLIFSAPPYEKVIIVPDTNYITFAIRKFKLDMPSPGSFQNIGVLI